MSFNDAVYVTCLVSLQIQLILMWIYFDRKFNGGKGR